MLAKLAEIQKIEDQANYLTQLIEQSTKNSKQFIDQLSGDIINKLEKKVNKQNFQLWLQLLITALSVQQKFQYASSPKQFSTPLLKLVQIIGSQDADEKHQKVAKLLGKYSGMQTSIMLHTFLARNSAASAKEDSLARLIPIFIRLSSFIIQKFLQLKNEPAKGTEDRIQDDRIILQCCQKWVATNIITFFTKLNHPKKLTNKQIVLLSICDVVGALLQISRGNIIGKQITDNLFKQGLLKYCQANYSWNEIYDVFMSSLSNRNFNNPITKIQIPQLYTEDQIKKSGLNAQAYTYLMVNFIKCGLNSVNSQASLLKILVPAVGEIVSRPYQIKLEAIYMLQKVSESLTPIKIKSGFQFDYPIQLLFFNLFNFQQEKFESVRKHFVFQKQESIASSLLLLKFMVLDNLTKQKDKYILKTLAKQNIICPKTILILRKFKWKQQKVKTQTLLLQVAQKLSKEYSKQIKSLVNQWKSQARQGVDEKLKEKIKSLLS